MRPRLIAALVLCCSTSLHAQTRFPGADWQRVNPATVGWDTLQLQRALSFADSIGSKALLIVQDGRVVVDWGKTSERYHVFSIRKSLLNSLIGILVSEGKLNLQSTLADLGIDDKPLPLTAEEKQATVRDLLMARSGVYHLAAYETPGMVNNRPARGSHAHGTFWFYNNWDFNTLVTIAQKAAQTDLIAMFDERIAKPIHMQDFRRSDVEFFYDSVSMHPAQIYRMSARDLARFGLMFMNGGKWENRQVVPAEWVKESLQPYSDLGIRGGYGYLWWVALKGEHFPFVKFPDGTFSARGTSEQDLLMIPAWNMIIVNRTDYELQHIREREQGVPARMVRVTDFGKLLQRLFAARSTN